MTPHPPHPVSWMACPYCGAKPHSPCVRAGGRYPMGTYHVWRKNAARIAAAKEAGTYGNPA